jgi:hypothetical protein
MTKRANHFVWTKIGHEAGELIDNILLRKDAERCAGSFWWGIGSSLDRKKLAKAWDSLGGRLQVLFSKQLTRPKTCGFGGMKVWTQWLDETGALHEVPEHALVISKGRSERYYALVCHSENSIACLHDQPFDEQLFRNYPDGGRPGNSQNTALLTGNSDVDHSRGRYRVVFTANLMEPRLVTLTNPRLLSKDEEGQIARWDGKDYLALIRRIRGRSH